MRPCSAEITLNWAQSPVCNPSPFLVSLRLPSMPKQNGFFSQDNRSSIHQSAEALLRWHFPRTLKRSEWKWKPQNVLLFRSEPTFTLVSGGQSLTLPSNMGCPWSVPCSWGLQREPGRSPRRWATLCSSHRVSDSKSKCVI